MSIKNQGDENQNSLGPGQGSARIAHPVLSGRELDAAVAERVFGWRWWRSTLRFSTEVRRALMQPELKNDEWQLADGTEEIFSGPYIFVSHYSTSIAAAIEVVEQVGKRGFQVSIVNPLKVGTLAADNIRVWWVQFADLSCAEFEAESDSLPEAICRAALLLTQEPDTSAAEPGLNANGTQSGVSNQTI